MNSGYKDAIIRTTDTDIVVPAVAYFQDWKTSETSGLLLAQGKISDIYQCMSKPEALDLIWQTVYHFSIL